MREREGGREGESEQEGGGGGIINTQCHSTRSTPTTQFSSHVEVHM